MLTGVFKDRSRHRSAKDRASIEEQALAEILATRQLREFTLVRHCEIGPFRVEYLFPERSLILELIPATADSERFTRQHAARRRFFNDMGYVVLAIDPRDLRRRRQQVLARLQAALRS